jgi:hypothetical protein
MTGRISWPSAEPCGSRPTWRRMTNSEAGGAIDERTARHEGYGISQEKKRIEECFGWLKKIALLPKVRQRGIFKVDWYTHQVVGRTSEGEHPTGRVIRWRNKRRRVHANHLAMLPIPNKESAEPFPPGQFW